MELQIFSLNCWGIPCISKDRKPRMQAIAEALAVSSYDVVSLQEVWTTTDFNLIKNKISGSFPYSHYYYSGVTGSGVCIFSKYPILGVFFHQWTVNGYVHKVQHGDWFGGKGVGLCQIKVNDYNVSIYSAHLHAEYNRKSDEYEAHRVIQAFDTAQFIKLSSAQADVAILAGDLNTEPGDLAYRILTSITGLKDAYSELFTNAQNVMTTNESLTNSYTDRSLVKKMRPGKRIDYVMYLGSSNVGVKLESYRHPLPDRVPGSNYSYSDHEAILACLKLSHKKESIEKTYCDTSATTTVLGESVEVCNKALARLVNHKRFYWFLTAIFLMLLITMMAIDAPFGFTITYNVLRVLVTILMIFTFIMATLWNMIETNGILAGKLEMEICMKHS